MASVPFRVLISVTIIASSILVGVEADVYRSEELPWVLTVMDFLCTLTFLVEILLKLFALGCKFFCSGWNILDLFLVRARWPSLGDTLWIHEKE